MPVVGSVDTIDVTLEVWGVDTQLTVLMLGPEGQSLDAGAVPLPPPSDAPAQARRRWRARFTYPEAGIWWVQVTVAGTGEGRAPQPYRVAVGPAGPGTDPRHTYATSADLARVLNAAPPLDAERMLRDATQLVDDALLFAVYDVDDDGMPTDPAHALAMQLATCAVVKWWDDNGWDGSGAEGQVQSASIAGVSLGFARSQGGRVDLVGTKARQILTEAGLLGHGPWY